MAHEGLTTGPHRRAGLAAAALSSLLLCAACGGSSEPAPARAASTPEAAEPERVPVSITGRTFRLELALDDATRFRGLSGRGEIAPDDGMLFVFPYAARLAFVMRDCDAPIDIAYLDGAGRIVSMYTMQPEDPRRPGESDYDYEQRLRKYQSRFPAQFVVELRGGRLDELGVVVGDKMKFDTAGLKARAR